MKKMKKILAVVLSLTVMFTMGIATTAVSFADETSTHTITITNTDQNVSHTYKGYQIFKGKLDAVPERPYLFVKCRVWPCIIIKYHSLPRVPLRTLLVRDLISHSPMPSILMLYLSHRLGTIGIVSPPVSVYAYSPTVSHSP